MLNGFNLISLNGYTTYLKTVVVIYQQLLRTKIFPFPDTLANDGINVEFNVRAKPDCGGTVYENQNRSWFYFSIHGGLPSRACKINVVNMNKQSKLYTQGMQPVMRVGDGPNAKWERLREPLTHVVSILLVL